MVSSNTTTTYSYDAAGREARETVVVDGRQQADTRITYDALGRIATLDDPDYRLTYRYDGAGNRTVITNDYLNHKGEEQHQELYYRYDSMNRVIISQGVKTTGAVADITVTADQGTILTYDTKGDRTSVTTKGTVYNEVVTVNGNQESFVWNEVAGPNGLSTTDYTYDGAGRLTTTSKQTNQTITNPAAGTSTTNSIFTIVDVHAYDQVSRLTLDENSAVVNHALSVQDVVMGYDADGREVTQRTSQDGVVQSQVTFGTATLNAATHTWTTGYDAADILRGYTVDVYKNGAYNYTTTYKDTYRLSSGYLQTAESAHSVGTGAPQDGSTSRTYNVDGFLVQFTDTAAHQNDRYFANDALGHTLATIEGQFDGQSGRMTVSQAWDAAVDRNTWAGVYNVPQAQYFFYADGNYIGSFGQLQSADGAFAANFDVNYTPVSSQYPANAPAKVVVQEGDTLRIVAARVYGDSSLWYLIAQKNGLTDPDAQLSPGTTLTIPNDVVSLPNSSSSFKPFDPAAAIGDTTPTQPAPPPPHQSGGGCGVFGQILEIAVAIVVTYFTAGAATGLDAVWAGAIGGAAGSAASQVVAIADGDQQGFNWKGVALGAIGGAVTAGIGETGLGSGLGDLGQAAVQAAASSVVTQGIGVLTGLQDHFSWSQVAVAAATAPAARAAGRSVDSKYGSQGYHAGFEANLAANAASGLATASVQLALNGKVQTQTILADVFGNTLGDSIVHQVSAPGATSAIATTAGQDGINTYEGAYRNSSLGRLTLADLDTAPAGNDVPVGVQSLADFQPTLEDIQFDAAGLKLDTPTINTGVAGNLSADQVSPIQQQQSDSQGLTADDLLSTLDMLKAGIIPKGVPSGVRVFDRDAIDYVNNRYDEPLTAEKFSERETLRGLMKQADDSLSGPSQLVALFGADDTPLTKLQGALRIGGGYLSAQAAQNLLEQINSGSQAIDLTAVRAGSEAVFNRAVAAQDALQMSNNPIGGLDAGVDETLSWDEDVVRNSDNLMPPRLAITEMGVTREIDTGINQAMAAAAVADLGLPLLLAARGPLQFWETAALRGHLGNAIDRFNVQGYTYNQALRLKTNPEMADRFTGERIDQFFRESLRQDPDLSHLVMTPRGKAGPDAFDPYAFRWWDVTTPKEWVGHVRKYGDTFGQGTPLFWKR